MMFQNGMQRAITDITDDYRIIHFQHPDEALNYIETSFEIDNPVDIIISDYNHPGMDGYVFAVTVKMLELKYQRKYKIPLLMISLVASYFHPGEETIEDFLVRNKNDEANDRQYAEEFIARGIEVEAITAALTKNCTVEQVIDFWEYLSCTKELRSLL
jgi:CheY-like chemotaxis protein